MLETSFCLITSPGENIWIKVTRIHRGGRFDDFQTHRTFEKTKEPNFGSKMANKNIGRHHLRWKNIFNQIRYIEIDRSWISRFYVFGQRPRRGRWPVMLMPHRKIFRFSISQVSITRFWISNNHPLGLKVLITVHRKVRESPSKIRKV